MSFDVSSLKTSSQIITTSIPSGSILDLDFNSNKVSQELEYPPVPILGNSYTVTQGNYGLGNYIASASSTYSTSGTTYSPFFAFESNNFLLQNDSFWNSGLTYNATTGNYTGTTGTTAISGTRYNGEWLQIQLPKRIKLSSINILPNTTYYRYLNLNNNIEDQTGNSTPVATGSISYVSGVFASNAAYFNNNVSVGASNYIHVPHGSYLGDMSVSFWFNTQSVASYQTMVSLCNSTYTSPAIQFDLLANGTLQVYMALPSKWTFNLSNFRASINTWYHITLTLSSSTYTARLYVNGSQTATNTGSGMYSSNDSNRWLLGGSGDQQRSYKGYIDEFRVFNSVLTPTEVTQLYNNNVIVKNAPRDFTLLGSNDSSNWNLIYNTTGVSNWSTSQKTFNVTSNKYFNYYRLITSRVGNSDLGSSQNSLQIARLRLYGDEENKINTVGISNLTGLENFKPSNVIQDGLIAYFDPNNTKCYPGTGGTLYNLIDNSTATLTGSYNFTSGNIRLNNTNSNANNNTSSFQLASLNTITTISMWFRQESNNVVNGNIYLLDMRTGGAGGWIFNDNSGPGSNWSSGTFYKNGGTAQSITWNNIQTIGSWQNITVIANTAATDDMTLFGRFSQTEGIDVTFGPILIYNRVISQEENAFNFNAFRSRYNLDGGYPIYSPIRSGLIAYYDPANPISYPGTGATMSSLVGSVAATLNGTYNFTSGNIRLNNTNPTSSNNTSVLQLASLNTITTVSLWFRQESNNVVNGSTYLLDMRTGGPNGWIYNTWTGDNWGTGTLYKNGGTAQSITWNNIQTIGSWQNITVIANTPATDDITLFGRYSKDEGLDITLGPVLIYNRAITQAENAFNFNVFRKRFNLGSEIGNIERPLIQTSGGLNNTQFIQLSESRRSNLESTITSSSLIATGGGFTAAASVRFSSSNTAPNTILNCTNLDNTQRVYLGQYANFIHPLDYTGITGGSPIVITQTNATSFTTGSGTPTYIFDNTQVSQTLGKTFLLLSNSHTSNSFGSTSGSILSYQFVIPTAGSYNINLQVLPPNSNSARIHWALDGVYGGNDLSSNTRSNFSFSQIYTSSSLSIGTHTLVLQGNQPVGFGGFTVTSTDGKYYGYSVNSKNNLVFNIHNGDNLYPRINNFYLPPKTIPSGQVIGADVKNSLSGFATGSSIDILGNLSQPTRTNMPTYTASGGFNNLPYISFNRTNSQFLQINPLTLNIATNGGFTAMTLVRFTGTASLWERIFDFGNGTGDNNLILYRNQTTGNIILYISNNTPSQTVYQLITNTSPLIQNTWCVFGCRYNRSNNVTEIFANGSVIMSGTSTVSLIDRTLTSNFIGKSNWAGETPANMDMSSFFVYDRCLSDKEMNDLYLYMTSNQPTLDLTKWNNLTVNYNQNSGNVDMYNKDQLIKRETAINVYPPIAMANNTTNISGALYGNGNYIASASSEYSSGSFPAYKAFDYISGENMYHSEWSLYNATTGSYIGSNTTTVSGVSYSGEWLQIVLPSSIKIYEYKIIPRAGYTTTQAPNTWVLAGSTNGNTWVLLDSRSSEITWTTAGKSYKINSSNYYNYYRMICTVTGETAGSDRQAFVLSQLYLFGLEQITNKTFNSVSVGKLVSNGQTNYSNLNIAHLRIYDRNLSQKEITTLSNVSNKTIAGVQSDVSTQRKGADKPVILLDSRVLTLSNGTAISDLNGFTQGNSSKQPIFYTTGGYSNRGYINFNRINNQFLQISKPLTLNIATNGGFTAMALVRFNGTLTDWERIFEFGNGSSNNNIILTRVANTSNLTFSIFNGVNSYGITANSQIVQNTWQVFACRYKVSTNFTELFVNGTLVASGTSTQTLTDRTLTTNYIGLTAWNGFQSANMDLAGFYAYDRALSNTELTNLYNRILSGAQIDLVDETSKLNKTIDLSNTICNIDVNNKLKSLDDPMVVGLVEFPPQLITSSQTPQLISNSPYGNGTYYVSSSSIGGSNNNNLAFDKDTTTQWASSDAANFVYNTTTGIYSGLTTTIDLSGTTHSGEWIQIQLPNTLQLYHFVITPENTSNATKYSPRNFVLLGSTDGCGWRSVYTGTNVVNWAQGVAQTFYLSNTKFNYKYYRFVANRVGNFDSNSGQNICSISELKFFGVPKQSDTLVYPPVEMTANSYTIASTSGNYGVGTYTASASSVLSNPSDFSAYRAFESTGLYEGTDNFWSSNLNVYNAPTGVYTGSVSTTAGSTGIAGEWLQIQTPQSINVSSFTILPRQDSQLWNVRSWNVRSPRNFNLLGSNDGTTWVSLGAWSNVIWTNAAQNFNVASNIPYNRYRLVVTRVGNPNMINQQDSVQIARWQLFSDIQVKQSPQVITNIAEYTQINPEFAPKLISGIQQYPPVNMTANTTAITKSQYGNGSYIASASTTSNPAYYAFDSNTLFQTNVDHFWASADTYNATTGSYTGSVSTTAGSTAYSGEWLQIQMPQEILLKSFNIYPSQTNVTNRSPRSFVVLGSNNGTTWNLLHTVTDYISWSSYRNYSFNVSGANIYYNYYRIVIQRVGNANSGSSQSQVNIACLQLFGLEQNDNYITFNNTRSEFLNGGTRTLGIADNGGFTSSALVKFSDSPIANETIYDFGTLGNTTANLYLSRSGTTGNLTFGKYNNIVTTTTTPIIANKWMLLSTRYKTTSNRLEIFKDNQLITSSTMGSIGNSTCGNTFIARSMTGVYSNIALKNLVIIDRWLDNSNLDTLNNRILGQSFESKRIVEYPPTALSGSTSTVANGSYGNGTYVATSTPGSSELMFNKINNAGSAWSSGSGQYPFNSVYTGTVTTTDINNISYSGIWIQLQLPKPIVLTSFSLRYRYPTRAPRVFTLLGSNNDDNRRTWIKLYANANETRWSSQRTLTFNVNATAAYSYYRFITHALTGPNDGSGMLNTEELMFYGYEESQSLPSVSGRYIRISALGRNPDNTSTTVNVPEISVYDTNNNLISLNKTTSISSVSNNNSSSYAVDGNYLLSGIKRSVMYPPGSLVADTSSISSTSANYGFGSYTVKASSLSDRSAYTAFDESGSVITTAIVQSITENQATTAVSTWTNQSSAADNNWFKIVWSPQLRLFVANSVSGSGNRIMTSPNGINWTSRTSAADNSWIGIAWSPKLGLFATVSETGSENRVMTSPDGINWTTRTTNNNNWHGICWSEELGIFVAVGYSGSGNRVMTSSDGINWTVGLSAVDNQWLDVCWSKELSLFVAVSNTGSANRVMTSPDGISWTIRTTPNNDWSSVTWSAELGIFVSVASSGSNRVMVSSDGINWTGYASAAESNIWRQVVWAKELGLFVAVSETGSGNRIMTSPNGMNWTSRTTLDNNWRGIAWAAELGIFAAVARTGTGNRVMTSTNVYTASNFIYNTTTGSYNGSTITYDRLGKSYTGEWLQITLPELIYPTGIQITPNSTTWSTSAPTNLTLLASTNALDWEPLIANTTTTWTTSGSKTFNINGTSGSMTAYDNYRFIANSIGTNNTTGLLSIQETKILGGTNYGQTSVLEFPPIEMTNATTAAVSLSYGNGTYTASASSVYSNPSDFSAFKAFNSTNLYADGSDNFWHSNSGYSSGNYTGSASTTVGSTGISGEWIQIALPREILLDSIEILPRFGYNNNNRAPCDFYIVGSTDGTTWTNVYRGLNFFTWNNFAKNFVINSTVAYTYYRLIITKIVGTDANSDSVQIARWKLYGRDVYTASTNSSNSEFVQVDLGTDYPISKVVIHNNLTNQGSMQERYLTVSNSVSNVVLNKTINTTNQIYDIDLSRGDIANRTITNYQELYAAHNDITYAFDNYYDGTWKSEIKMGSSYQIGKQSNTLNFRAGSTINNSNIETFTDCLTISTSGSLIIGNSGAPISLLLEGVTTIDSGNFGINTTTVSLPNIMPNTDYKVILCSETVTSIGSSLYGNVYKIVAPTVGGYTTLNFRESSTSGNSLLHISNRPDQSRLVIAQLYGGTWFPEGSISYGNIINDTFTFYVKLNLLQFEFYNNNNDNILNYANLTGGNITSITWKDDGIPNSLFNPILEPCVTNKTTTSFDIKTYRTSQLKINWMAFN